MRTAPAVHLFKDWTPKSAQIKTIGIDTTENNQQNTKEKTKTK